MKARAVLAVLLALTGLVLAGTPAQAAACTDASRQQTVAVPTVGRVWVDVWASTCPGGTRVDRVEVVAPRPVEVLAVLYTYRRPPLRTVVTWRGATPAADDLQVLWVDRTLPAGPSPVGSVGLDIYAPGHGAGQATIQVR